VSTESRIYDSGYRRYDGPRLGPNQAFKALITHTLQRVFGLHRPARTKVFPMLSTVIAYLPPAIFVGLAAFLPKQLTGSLPKFSDIYGFISAAVLVFVIFVAPESLCPDRRSGSLSLYLAAPLTRNRYLAAKGTSIFLALLFVTLGPPLLFLIGLSLQNGGPHGPGGWLLAFTRIVASGVFVAAFYTTLSLAAASVTDRRAVAAAGTFIVVIASNVVAGILVHAAGFSDNTFAISLSAAPFELTRRIHGEPILPDFHVSTVALVVSLASWASVALVVAWQRYRTLQVTR
jgi:ABC-2 type transport system permease protein